MDSLNPNREELRSALREASRSLEDKLKRVTVWENAVYWASMLLTAVTAGVFWLLIVDRFSEPMKWIGAFIGTLSFVLAIFSTRNPFGDRASLLAEMYRLSAVSQVVLMKSEVTREDVALLLPSSIETPLRHVGRELRDRIWSAAQLHHNVSGPGATKTFY